MKEIIAIIGNGISAITAIKSIRNIDKESEIHLFGDEKFYPYNRIRLSKGLLGSLEEDKILLQKKNWYEENDINMYLDTKVKSVDTSSKELELSTGDKLKFTKLLFANGSHNFTPPIPGIDKKGVTTLRTLEDAWSIVEKVKDINTILNIGGGIQGLETAWILSQLDKKIIIVELLPRLMPKQLDEIASKILENAILSYGIDIMLNTKIDGIYGDETVAGVHISTSESIPCDMVTYSIGIRPNIELVKNSPININRGIIVNEKMETNIDGIYAAGDVTELHGHIYGLWNISIGYGKVAGSNIAGEDVTYQNIVPVTTLNAFNLSLFSMGIVENEKATDIIVEDKSDTNIYNKVLINNGKIIGAIVIGNLRYSPVLKTAIEKELDFSDIDFTNVSFSDLIQIIKTKK